MGTHLLIPLARSGWDRPDPLAAYRAYETLCDFYSESILARYGRRRTQLKGSSVFSPEVRAQLDRWHREDPTQTPATLFSRLLGEEP
ncbi:MAG: hypothetical protein ACM3ZC_11525 [Bacteroidota bacterium]